MSGLEIGSVVLSALFELSFTVELVASLAASLPRPLLTSVELDRSPRPSRPPILELVPAPYSIELTSKSKLKSSKKEFGSNSSSKAVVEPNEASKSS